MDIFSKLQQDQLVSRFQTEIGQANAKLQRKVDINTTSRQKNLQDFIAVMPQLNEIISSISVFENGLTPSFALSFSDEQISRRTKNKSAVEFSVMMYIQEDKRLPDKEVDFLYKSLDKLCEQVDIEGRIRKCYITLVFDKHEYKAPVAVKSHEAVTEYYNSVIKPTEDENPIGQADINQVWMAAIEWYKSQQN